MASSLSKEMEMMEAQLKRWQETAHETLSLRDEAQSLKALLSSKVSFHHFIKSYMYYIFIMNWSNYWFNAALQLEKTRVLVEENYLNDLFLFEQCI